MRTFKSRCSGQVVVKELPPHLQQVRQLRQVVSLDGRRLVDVTTDQTGTGQETVGVRLAGQSGHVVT